MIHHSELDPTKGYLSQLRALHPIRCGSEMDGKMVIETCWVCVGNYDKPVYRLEGDKPWEYRDA
jgi:hypothetical protein